MARPSACTAPSSAPAQDWLHRLELSVKRTGHASSRAKYHRQRASSELDQALPKPSRNPGVNGPMRSCHTSPNTSKPDRSPGETQPVSDHRPPTLARQGKGACTGAGAGIPAAGGKDVGRGAWGAASSGKFSTGSLDAFGSSANAVRSASAETTSAQVSPSNSLVAGGSVPSWIWSRPVNPRPVAARLTVKRRSVDVEFVNSAFEVRARTSASKRVCAGQSGGAVQVSRPVSARDAAQGVTATAAGDTQAKSRGPNLTNAVRCRGSVCCSRCREIIRQVDSWDQRWPCSPCTQRRL